MRASLRAGVSCRISCGVTRIIPSGVGCRVPSGIGWRELTANGAVVCREMRLALARNGVATVARQRAAARRARARLEDRVRGVTGQVVARPRLGDVPSRRHIEAVDFEAGGIVGHVERVVALRELKQDGVIPIAFLWAMEPLPSCAGRAADA